MSAAAVEDIAEETAARELLARAVRLSGALPRVVLLDGRSGSGKTTLAAALRPVLAAACAEPVELLRVEDLYPGWDGLAQGAAAVPEVLRTGRYRRYDWISAAFAEEHALDRGRPLVIEGCGALGGANLAAAREWAGGRPGAVLPVWMELSAAERRARALTRDGETFRPHWERWARQEDELSAREHPVALAREILHSV